MGKETKIGLAVIGVLAVTFGGLLTRKVWLANSPQPAAHAPDRRVPAKPLTTAGMDKPTPVVTPLDEAAAHAAHQAREEAARHADHDLPPREYMPPRAPRADEMAESTIPTRHPVQNAVATEPATGNNPFRRGAVQTSAVEAADADTDIPDHQPREHQAAARSEAQDEPAPLRGAVRQAGATEPIDESTSEEPALAVPTADLDAAELAVEEEPTEQTEPIRLRASNTPPQHEEEQTPAEPAEQDFPAATPAPTRWHSAPAEPERVAPAAATTAMPENGKYTVGPNDTLSSISEKVYGTSSYFKALHEHNRNRMTHRDRLAVGTILIVHVEMNH